MKNDEYVTWDWSKPGISFNLTYGRITLFKATLKTIGEPEYVHFLCNADRKKFAIEPCSMDDPGSHRLMEQLNRESCDIKCMQLVRFVYQCCGWNEKTTYRLEGRVTGDYRRVEFDLSETFVIVDGRVKQTDIENINRL